MPAGSEGDFVSDDVQNMRMKDPVSPPLIPIVGVGVVIWNDKRELVLIRRGKPPRLGEWSIPGGHVEWGEGLRQAAIREAREETGLDTEVVGLIDVIDSIGRDADGTANRHYVLVDFTARSVSGELSAGTDASDARWVPYESLDDYSLWSETRRVIEASARSLR
jgi:8-oxo-dGTP diphosphatase